LKIAILYDNISNENNPDEIDILHQITVVKKSLTSKMNKIVEIPFNPDFKEFSDIVDKEKPDFVFNLVESVGGKGSLIHLAPEYLETLNIPFTGSSSEALKTTSNKLDAKIKMETTDIPTADWVTLKEEYIKSPVERKKFIIKAVWEHASKGIDSESIVTVNSIEELREKIKAKNEKEGYEFFAEEFIDGREFNVAVISRDGEPICLNPAELKFYNFEKKHKIVDFKAKWDVTSSQYDDIKICSEFTDNDKELLNNLKIISLKAWEVFKIKGYARFDYRVSLDNQIYMLEVNANPCISPDAGFFAACVKAGLKIKNIIKWISQDLNK